MLTVHLKRFSPLGRKISHQLQYDEELSLKPYMSAGSFGPTYSLYGVICHAGGGPNSGHYYAFVKSREGRWFEMNDESVSASGIPTDRKNAYMLFYIQNKGQGLEAAVKAPLNGILGPPLKNGLAASMKKRIQKVKDTEDDEDKGVKVGSTFIGPLLPSAEITGAKAATSPSAVDPQALALKSKIEAAAKKKATQALASLDNYDSDNDSEASTPAHSALNEKENDRNMDVDVKGKRKHVDGPPDDPPPPSSPAALPPSSQPSLPTPSVPTSSFYASANKKKRKSPHAESENSKPSKSPGTLSSRTNGYSSNPYNRAFSKRKRIGL